MLSFTIFFLPILAYYNPKLKIYNALGLALFILQFPSQK